MAARLPCGCSAVSSSARRLPACTATQLHCRPRQQRLQQRRLAAALQEPDPGSDRDLGGDAPSSSGQGHHDFSQMAQQLNRLMERTAAGITGEELRQLVYGKWGRNYEMRLHKRGAKVYFQVIKGCSVFHEVLQRPESLNTCASPMRTRTVHGGSLQSWQCAHPDAPSCRPLTLHTYTSWRTLPPLLPQVMWKHLQQASFHLSEAQYKEQLDAVAFFLNKWGAAERVRSAITADRSRGPGASLHAVSLGAGLAVLAEAAQGLRPTAVLCCACGVMVLLCVVAMMHKAHDTLARPNRMRRVHCWWRRSVCFCSSKCGLEWRSQRGMDLRSLQYSLCNRFNSSGQQFELKVRVLRMPCVIL